MSSNNAAVRLSEAETEQKLKKIEAGADLVQQFMTGMAKEREAALKIADPKERQEKVELIDAKIADVRKETAADTNDIAQVVGAVLAKEQELDAQFEQLSTYNDAQKAELQDKENAVKAAETAVEEAKTASTWLGLKDPKGAAAAALELAKTDLTNTKTRIDKLVRDEVLKADFQTSIKTLQLRMERSVRGLQKHHGVLAIEFGVITASKDKSFKIATEQAAEKTRLDGVLESLERDLAAQIDKLPHILDKSEATAAEGIIANLKMHIEQTTNLRNSALGVQMEQSKNASDYSNIEVAVLQEMGTIQNLVDIMNVKVENLPKMREHYVKVMQGGAIIEIGKTLAQVGDKSADTIAERITRTGQASRNAAHEYYGSQPAELAKKTARRQAQEAAQLENLKADDRIAKAFSDAGVDFNRVFGRRGDSAENGPAA